MTEALEKLISAGVLGTVLVICLIALYFKDKRLGEETQARIDDGKETQKLLMQVQSSVVDAVHKLAEIVEWAEKRADESLKERRRP
jgi:hypothetical protein